MTADPHAEARRQMAGAIASAAALANECGAAVLYSDLKRADDNLLQLAAREERLREALSFYAQQRGLGSRLASDGGTIARNALSTPEADE